jgi:alpha-beta hydrolase superfamily lysophospholipase
MRIILIGLGAFTLATLVLLALVAVARRLLGGRPRWRNVLVWTLALVPVHALLTVPAALGYVGSRYVGTRGDERGYGGPRFDGEGAWSVQDRASLARDRAAGEAAAPSPPTRALALRSGDGTPLRAFFVPGPPGGRKLCAVLVHGLFRGGLELETVGRWLRAEGCGVCLLELRNHGGSGRAPATFGVGEAGDVLAACRAVRQLPECAGHGLLLFGVSLGTVAVALAAPAAEDLAGLVLDAPVLDLAGTAHRMLARGPRDQPRRLGLPQPFRSLALWFLELWSGVDLEAVRPADALARLDPSVAALVIAAENDDRVLPAEVEAVFRAIPAPAERKALWVCPGAEHGSVWETDPAGYRERLRWLLEQAER